MVPASCQALGSAARSSWSATPPRLTATPRLDDDRDMPEIRENAFTNLGEYAKRYKALVVKNDMTLSAAILSALDKVDANKVAAKHDALVEAAMVAMTKWDAAWTEETKKVTNPTEKGRRAELAVGVFKIRQELHGGAPAAPPGRRGPTRRQRTAPT